MARVLVINPNCSTDCSAGIDAAIQPFRFAGGPVLHVTTLEQGPPAVYSWRDWHAVVGPLCEPCTIAATNPVTRTKASRMPRTSGRRRRFGYRTGGGSGPG